MICMFVLKNAIKTCVTLMHDFDKWIIEKMDFTKGVNEKLK